MALVIPGIEEVTLEEVQAEATKRGLTPEKSAEVIRRWQNASLEFMREAVPTEKYVRASKVLVDPAEKAIQEAQKSAVANWKAAKLPELLPDTERQQKFLEMATEATQNGKIPSEDDLKSKVDSDLAAAFRDLKGVVANPAFAPSKLATNQTIESKAGAPLATWDALRKPDGSTEIQLQVPEEIVDRGVKIGDTIKDYTVTVPPVTEDDYNKALESAQKRYSDLVAESRVSYEQGASRFGGRREPAVISRELDNAEAQLQALEKGYEAAKPMLTSEKLQETLKNPTNPLFEKLGKRNLLEDFTTGLVQGAFQMEIAASDFASVAVKALTLGAVPDVAGPVTTQLRESATDFQKQFPGSTAREFQGGSIAQDAISAFGAMIPALTTSGLISKALEGFSAAAAKVGGMAAGVGAQAYGATYADMLNDADAAEAAGNTRLAKMLRDNARTAATLNGVAEMGTEMLFGEEIAALGLRTTRGGLFSKLGALADNPGVSGTFAKYGAGKTPSLLNRVTQNTLKAVLGNSVEEAAAQVIQGGMISPVLQGVDQGSAAEVGRAALIGGIIGAPMGVASAVRAPNEQAEIAQGRLSAMNEQAQRLQNELVVLRGGMEGAPQQVDAETVQEKELMLNLTNERRRFWATELVKSTAQVARDNAPPGAPPEEVEVAARSAAGGAMLSSVPTGTPIEAVQAAVDEVLTTPQPPAAQPRAGMTTDAAIVDNYEEIQLADIAQLPLLAEGSESTVYRDGNEVIKVSEPYNAAESAAPRVAEILRADQMIGNGDLQFRGYYRGKNGIINPVFAQPFIEGRGATDAEIEKHMLSRGFTREGNNYVKTVDGVQYVAHDLDSDNVKVANGKISVIDASIYTKNVPVTSQAPVSPAEGVGQVAPQTEGLSQTPEAGTPITTPPQPAPASEVTAAVDELNRIHSASLRAVPPPSTGLGRMAQEIRQLSGRQLIFVEGQSRFDGVQRGNNLFVKVNGGQVLRNVIGEELGHSLESLPGYGKLVQLLRERNPEKYGEYQDALLELEYAPDQVEREFVANVIGEAVADRAFWRKLAQTTDPTVLQRMYDTLATLIDKILAIARGQTGQRPVASTALDNLEKAREAVRELLLSSGNVAGTGTAQSRSVVTPSQDAAYLAAVESGDMETAQRMVDEAAKAAGYGVGPVNHRTLGNFTVFDLLRASKSAVWGPAIYASFDANWNPSALSGGKNLSGYVGGKVIDFTKPITPEDAAILSNFLGREIRDSMPFITLEKRYGSVAEGLKAAGYSAAIHNGPGSTGRHIAVFSPNQIKSADPVTRDESGNVIPLSQRFNPETDNINYSRSRRSVTPSQDAAYLAAVEADDMETVQRMVDSAAKAAGYNVGKVWHGSYDQAALDADPVFRENAFTEADGQAFFGKGFYFSGKKRIAENYTANGVGPRPYFLALYKPFNFNTQGHVLDWTFPGGIDPVTKKRKTNDRDYSGYQDFFKRHGYDGAVAFSEKRFNGEKWVDAPELPRGPIENADEIVVFNPSQIKSADPVTRDDSGNIIPLSQRFNPETDNINYSRSRKGMQGPLYDTVTHRRASTGAEYEVTEWKDLEAVVQPILDAEKITRDNAKAQVQLMRSLQTNERRITDQLTRGIERQFAGRLKRIAADYATEDQKREAVNREKDVLRTLVKQRMIAFAGNTGASLLKRPGKESRRLGTLLILEAQKAAFNTKSEVTANPHTAARILQSVGHGWGDDLAELMANIYQGKSEFFKKTTKMSDAERAEVEAATKTPAAVYEEVAQEATPAGRTVNRAKAKVISAMRALYKRITGQESRSQANVDELLRLLESLETDYHGNVDQYLEMASEAIDNLNPENQANAIKALTEAAQFDIDLLDQEQKLLGKDRDFIRATERFIEKVSNAGVKAKTQRKEASQGTKDLSAIRQAALEGKMTPEQAGDMFVQLGGSETRRAAFVEAVSQDLATLKNNEEAAATVKSEAKAAREASKQLVKEVGSQVAQAEDFQRKLEELAAQADKRQETIQENLEKSLNKILEDKKAPTTPVAKPAQTTARQVARKFAAGDPGVSEGDVRDALAQTGMPQDQIDSFMERLLDARIKIAEDKRAAEDEAKKELAARVFDKGASAVPGGRKTSVEEDILSTITDNPEWEVSDAEGKRKIIEEVLVRRGFTPAEAAEGSAAALAAFEKRMTAIIQKIIARFGRKLKRGKVTDAELQRIVRLGVLDPANGSLADMLSEVYGWKGLTTEEMDKVFSLVEKAKDIVDPQVRLSLNLKAMEIVMAAIGIPPAFRNIVSSNLRASQYGGLTSFFLQTLAATNSLIYTPLREFVERTLALKTITNPLNVLKDFANIVTVVAKNIRKSWNAAKIAWKTGAGLFLPASAESTSKVEVGVLNVEGLTQRINLAIKRLSDPAISGTRKFHELLVSVLLMANRLTWKVNAFADSFNITMIQSQHVNFSLYQDLRQQGYDPQKVFAEFVPAVEAATDYGVAELGLPKAEAQKEAIARAEADLYRFLQENYKLDPGVNQMYAFREAVSLMGNHAEQQGTLTKAAGKIVELGEMVPLGLGSLITGPIRIIANVAEAGMWFMPGYNILRLARELQAQKKGAGTKEFTGRFSLSMKDHRQRTRRANEVIFSNILYGLAVAIMAKQPDDPDDRDIWVSGSLPSEPKERDWFLGRGYTPYTLYYGKYKKGQRRAFLQMTRGSFEFLNYPLLLAQKTADVIAGRSTLTEASTRYAYDVAATSLPSIESAWKTLEVMKRGTDTDIHNEVARKLSPFFPQSAFTRSLTKIPESKMSKDDPNFWLAQLIPATALYNGNKVELRNALNENPLATNDPLSILARLGIPFGMFEPMGVRDELVAEDYRKMGYSLSRVESLSVFKKRIEGREEEVVRANGVADVEELQYKWIAERANAYKEIYREDPEPGENARDQRTLEEIIEDNDRAAYQDRQAVYWALATRRANESLGIKEEQ